MGDSHYTYELYNVALLLLAHVSTNMGWLPVVGFLKQSSSFAEYHLFHWAHLQKRPAILRSLLIVATPQVIFIACVSDVNMSRQKNEREGERVSNSTLWNALYKDSWDALSCRSFFAKEPLIVGLFLRKIRSFSVHHSHRSST